MLLGFEGCRENRRHVFEAFSHVIRDYVRLGRILPEEHKHVWRFKRSGQNPRFFHFADEDQMMVLKDWARRSDSKSTKRLKGREGGIMRLNRLHLKSLSWRLKKLVNRRVA